MLRSMLKPIETWISEWLTSSVKLHSCYISTTQHTLWIPTGYACVIPRALMSIFIQVTSNGFSVGRRKLENIELLDILWIVEYVEIRK